MEKIPQPENRAEIMMGLLVQQRNRIEKDGGEMAERLLNMGVVESFLREMNESPLRLAVQEDNSGENADRLSFS